MLEIIRELCKFCMVALSWLFPVFLSRWNDNNGFLWFFILSFVLTVGIFSHYECLESVYRYNKNSNKDESDE